MRVPVHQRVIRLGAASLVAIVGVGSLLDASSNATAIITPRITYLGTVVLALAVVVVHAVVSHHPIRWVTSSGVEIRITRVGPTFLAMIVGIAALLWLPRLQSATVDAVSSGGQPRDRSVQVPMAPRVDHKPTPAKTETAASPLKPKPTPAVIEIPTERRAAPNIEVAQVTFRESSQCLELNTTVRNHGDIAAVITEAQIVLYEAYEFVGVGEQGTPPDPSVYDITISPSYKPPYYLSSRRDDAVPAKGTARVTLCVGSDSWKYADALGNGPTFDVYKAEVRLLYDSRRATSPMLLFGLGPSGSSGSEEHFGYDPDKTRLQNTQVAMSLHGIDAVRSPTVDILLRRYAVR